MQITWKNWKNGLSGGGENTINVTPEDADDIWALYNLIAPGDEVECMTMRKILHESNSGDVVDSSKIKLILGVKVEKVDADLQTPSLRVNGKNVKETQHVKLGSYHTLDVGVDRWVKICKSNWDVLSIEILEQAVLGGGRAEVGAIVMEEGLAHVCSVTPQGCRVLARVAVNMPKKKIGPTSKGEKLQEKFISQCLDAFREHVKVEVLKAIVIGSTEAYLRDLFYAKLIEKAQEGNEKNILDNKSKFMKCQVASGQPNSLEILRKDPRIASILENTKSALEAKVLDAFFKMNTDEPERVTFGGKPVERAANEGAVKSLLLSDSLFRSTDLGNRRKYAELVKVVRENGGDVVIFSTGSQPEVELQKLAGIAAILNFPLFDEE